MSLKLLRFLRTCVPVPFVIHSIYMIILYSNGFWVKIMGTRHIWVSGFELLAAVLAWFSSIKAFELTNDGEKSTMGQLFTATWFLNLILAGSISYMTRDLKKKEYSYWMNIWLSENGNSFFYDSFIRAYKTTSDQEYFIQKRTLEVHDVSICVVILSILLYMMFIVNYEKIAGVMLEIRSELTVKTHLENNCDMSEPDVINGGDGEVE